MFTLGRVKNITSLRRNMGTFFAGQIFGVVLMIIYKVFAYLWRRCKRRKVVKRPIGPIDFDVDSDSDEIYYNTRLQEELLVLYSNSDKKTSFSQDTAEMLSL
ncbi:Hypothetical predicted protein [Cloeon dipterum]|uniref:Uncharacterized protein n=1 Tax=Cloeon dipterum TaxID=197152 RepID=A0A8S1DTJ5_9INSE|nr:Hypothetical predicted protein [Cloeon dipterum]